jgi:Ni,Fe-hydrogenase I cytochrome b subunit
MFMFSNMWRNIFWSKVVLKNFIKKVANFVKNYFLCNRTRNEHFAYLKHAAKSFHILEIVLTGRKWPRRQFFSVYVKEWFRGLDTQIHI